MTKKFEPGDLQSVELAVQPFHTPHALIAVSSRRAGQPMHGDTAARWLDPVACALSHSVTVEAIWESLRGALGRQPLSTKVALLAVTAGAEAPLQPVGWFGVPPVPGAPALLPQGLLALLLLAAARRTPVLFSSNLERRALVGDAELGPQLAGCEALAILPLLEEGGLSGVLLLGFAERRTLFAEDPLLLGLADCCAVALGHAHAHEVDRSARAQAEQRLSARDTILAAVSHDLRNLVGSVLAGACLIEKTVERGETQRGTLMVKLSAQRMRRLLDDLLDNASLERGKLSLVQREVDLTSVVREAVQMHACLASGCGHRLESCVPDEPLPMRCDPERVLQVLGNLIGNAIKFMPQGGCVSVGLEVRETEVELFVADTGPGLRPDSAGHLFESFWQVRPDKRGNGLGLSISRGLVEAHGGRIWVESPPCGGACFRFTLPR